MGSGLVLKNNDGDDLPVPSDGVYKFTVAQAAGSSYRVTVATPPVYPRQQCSLTGESGRIASADVTDVRLTCVDNFPPTLTQVVPQNGSQVFDPDDGLDLTFDDPVNSQTIDQKSFLIYGANNSSVLGVYTFPAAHRVRFTPQQPWNLAGSYRLALTTQIKDTAGNTLPTSLEATFSIRDGAWRAPEITGSAGTTVANPVGHALNNGDYNFLWSSTDTGVTSLNARTYARKTKTWSKPNTAPDPDRAVYSATRGVGNVTVVGELNSGPLLALDLVNGVWSPKALDISATSAPLLGNNSRYAPLVVSNESGDMLVAWEQTSPSYGNYQTRANIYHQGAWNSEALPVSNIRFDASAPAAAIDALGNAVAIWQEGDVSMRAKHYRPASGWDIAEAIIESPMHLNAALTKQLAYDAKSNVLAVWGNKNTGNSAGNSCCYEIVANNYRVGAESGWTGSTKIYTSATIAATDLKLNVSPAGDGNVVWHELSGTGVGYRNVTGTWFTEATRTWSMPMRLAIYDKTYRSVVLDNGAVVIALASPSSLEAAVFKEGKWSAVKSLWRQVTPHIIGPVALARNTNQVLAAWSLSITAPPSYDHAIWISRYVDGVWSADPMPVYKGTTENIVATSVSAVLDIFGNALITWCIDRGDTTYDVFAIRAANGVWQTQPDKLNTLPLATAVFTLDLDKAGNVTAFWNEVDKFVLRRFE